APAARDAREVLAQPVGLRRVVENDDAFGRREADPMADAEIDADEDERAAARKPQLPGRDALQGHARLEPGMRLVFGPQARIAMRGEELPGLDGSPVGAAARIPQWIDDV